MSKTKLMGIVNVTPDSFHEGSRAPEIEQAIAKALQLQADGADIVDIGGESTRPGSPSVSEAEELNRVIPIIRELKKVLSIPLSIDTKKPNVARAAVEAGASLINDVTGFTHPAMVQLAKETHLDICVMHMLGTPQTMQKNPHYENGVVPFLNQWFREKTNSLIDQGINPQRIILDPGIGFGKTVAHNLEIIHNLNEFKQLGFRILVGVSRKWFLGQIVKKPTHELLSATLAANTIAILNHVDVIRVHDVKEHRDLIDFIDAYQLQANRQL
jgi:dihydropteroate synthase